MLAALFAPDNACAGVAMVPSGKEVDRHGRSLFGTDRRPRECLVPGGVMLFGEQTDEAEALMLTDRALDAGLHFVGPVNIYSRGRSEEIIDSVG